MLVVALLLATIHPQLWPARKAPAPDTKIEKAVDKLLRSMTLEEKVGQVIQPAIVNITPDEVTAAEIAVTGQDWDFSPCVAVVRDVRWGRSYESFSEDPSIVRMCATNMVAGLRTRVITTAKHFLGDGGTSGGKDQGDDLAS